MDSYWIALVAFGFAIARFGVFLKQVASVGPLALRWQGMGSASVGAALVALGMIAKLFATTSYARIQRHRTRRPSATMVYRVGATVPFVGLVMTLLLIPR